MATVTPVPPDKEGYREALKCDPAGSRGGGGRAAGGGDTERSGMQWRRDKTDNENRPYTTLRQQQEPALGQVCQALFGIVNAEKLKEVRMTIAKGLDKKAMDVYISKVENIAAKEEPTQELMAMMAGVGFMPMVSETVSYRYSCRRSECRMIPMRESQWVIGKPASGGKPMWLCAACGKQYTHGIKASKDLVNGQDLGFNYTVLMQFEVKGGVRTLCAMAAAQTKFFRAGSTRSSWS